VQSICRYMHIDLMLLSDAELKMKKKLISNTSGNMEIVRQLLLFRGVGSDIVI
jgi:hypothetical protein